MLGLYNGTMKLNPYLSTLLCKAITFGGTKKNFVNGTVQSIGHCKTDIPSQDEMTYRRKEAHLREKKLFFRLKWKGFPDVFY